MLHGDLLTPRIRDNKNPICKKKDLEIFCSLLNVEVSDYYRFIAKLWNSNKKKDFTEGWNFILKESVHQNTIDWSFPVTHSFLEFLLL